MLRFWPCGKGVSVVNDGSEPEFEWRIGDSDPGVLGPLILMVDDGELEMIRQAMREHCWKGGRTIPERAADRTEAVNHPAHYGGDTTYEAIKVIEAWGLGFHDGNAVKYICRQGKKSDRLEDIEKAIWYLNRLAEQLRKER